MAEQSGQHFHQKLTVVEKCGYSAADAAANFVFMTMVLFQLNFYTDTFGLSATAAAAILLWPRLWDAVADPIVGILADRTNTRWGKFRPWILFTTVPWAVVMVLAYTTPQGWSMARLVAYAAITNTLLMTIYSMNNMPYAALGGVMTGDVQERASLQSYRFFAVNAAQFIVGGFTLPLMANFAAAHSAGGIIGAADRQYGWRMTMTIWAVLCFVLFLITFATTRERIHPSKTEKSSPGQDFRDLFKNGPWKIMFLWTLVHFAILSFRGGALYNYYHHYADKPAMFAWLNSVHLTAPPLAPGEVKTGLLDKWLGYIVHGDMTSLANSNVADVFNSIINMLGTGLIMMVILLSPGLARKYGKKTVCVAGFALATIGTFAFYLLPPTSVWGMLGLTAFISVVYAPTIPLTWAIFADVADFSEWTVGRRFTGIVFATIGFSLKSGLALGSAGFLWLMVGLYSYDSQGTPEFTPGDANTIASLKEVPKLTDKLKSSADPVSTYLKEHLSPETQQVLASTPNAAGSSAIESALIKDLNKLIAGSSLYSTQRFASIKLRSGTQDLLNKEKLSDYERLSLNRLLLEDAYPDEIAQQHNQTPDAKQGFRANSGIAVGILFAICTVLLMVYQLDKNTTLKMADELAERRKKLAPQTT